MDLRTGRAYKSLEEARKDGVPDSDLMEVDVTPDGEMRPAIKVQFSKGSFKPVTVEKEK